MLCEVMCRSIAVRAVWRIASTFLGDNFVRFDPSANDLC